MSSKVCSVKLPPSSLVVRFLKSASMCTIVLKMSRYKQVEEESRRLSMSSVNVNSCVET